MWVFLLNRIHTNVALHMGARCGVLEFWISCPQIGNSETSASSEWPLTTHIILPEGTTTSIFFFLQQFSPCLLTSLFTFSSWENQAILTYEENACFRNEHESVTIATKEHPDSLFDLGVIWGFASVPFNNKVIASAFVDLWCPHCHLSSDPGISEHEDSSAWWDKWSRTQENLCPFSQWAEGKYTEGL